MKPADSNRLNISAYRLVFLYQLFCHSGQLSHVELNRALTENPTVQRGFSDETLSKYLSTLEHFGCRFERVERSGQKIYRLLEHPLKLCITEEQMALLNKLNSIVQQDPTRTVMAAFKSLQDKTCYALEQPQTEEKPELPEHLVLLWQTFHQICQENQTLEIEIDNTLRLFEPVRVIYERKQLFLLGYYSPASQMSRIAIASIKHYKQLPTRIKHGQQRVYVVFQLSGRVAMNYTPYPNETISSKDQCIVVTHRTDDVETLLKRLLKYGSYCQVLSPQFAREESIAMIERLKQTLLSTELRLDDLLALNTTDTNEILHKWVCHLDIPKREDSSAVDSRQRA
jgi:predicted DNA-binding transcriptional regulator YafY